VKSGQDPKYVEAMVEIAKMENEKRLMEEKMERMQKHIEMLEHTVKHEIQKQEQVHEALDEWGMRDSVLERAKEIASVFTKNA
jgi:predicted  nucleic acid-binding Zn-ribbon protein